MNNEYEDERKFLEKVAKTYKTTSTGISKWSIDSYIKIYKKYIELDSIALELGCSNGYSTQLLSQMVKHLDVVDGSQSMIDRARLNSRYDNVEFIYELFEEINYKNKYDYIFASYILEHVSSPKDILNICYGALKDDGILCITVPNATALSRQMAVEMGLLGDVYFLTENDIAHGHRRVYDMNSLTKLVEETSFKIIDQGGTFVKPFADFQLNKMIDNRIIDEKQLEGLQALALKYYEISGSIYMILKKSQS